MAMSKHSSVEIVEAFWRDVWQSPQDPEVVDRYVTEDFVITSGGRDIESRQGFKRWVKEFLSKITDLEFDIIESFQNEDGSRVASRWRVRGRNNGILGTAPDQRSIEFTGIAVWAVRPDGKLQHNWVERSAWELYQGLKGI
jgi:hypothetical protein